MSASTCPACLSGHTVTVGKVEADEAILHEDEYAAACADCHASYVYAASGSRFEILSAWCHDCGHEIRRNDGTWVHAHRGALNCPGHPGTTAKPYQPGEGVPV